MSGAVPAGTRLVADASLRRLGGGKVLLGGSPLRLLRLSAAGSRLLDGWLAGEPVTSGASLARRLLDAGLVHPEPPAAPPPTVALVVPVKDDATGLARLLESTTDIPRRIVVDDGSRNPLPESTIRHPDPRGPAAARNAGWRQAGTELVVFLDADTEPGPGWLGAALRHFADPGVVAVAPRIVGAAGPSRLDRYESERSGLDMGPHPAPVIPLSRVSYVPSAALVVRRAALERLGGFAEGMRFGEDVDLVWRLRELGAVRYAPECRVHHRPRPTLRAWLRQRYEYGTSAAPLARRHPGLLSCARMSVWSFAAWGLPACGRPRVALLLAAGSAALLPRKLRARGVPAAEALGLAARGHLGAGALLAQAVRRGWWPLLAVLAPMSRRARWVLAAAFLPCLVEAVRAEHRGPSWALLRVLDDLAYSAGVWAGCLRERTAEPLLPRFTEGGLR